MNSFRPPKMNASAPKGVHYWFTELARGGGLWAAIILDKAAMAAFEILRLQPPRGAQLVRWEEQFRVCRADRPNRSRVDSLQ